MVEKLKIQRFDIVAEWLTRLLGGSGEAELAGVLISDKEGDLLQGKRIEQPAGNGSQHGVKIGLRTELAGELDQSGTVVVAITVKDVALQELLDPTADGLKDERRKQDQDQECRSGDGGGIEDDKNQSVEGAEHGKCRKGVDVALLENDVDVHQPVAGHRVGPCNGDEPKRKHGKAHEMRGYRTEQVG